MTLKDYKWAFQLKMEEAIRKHFQNFISEALEINEMLDVLTALYFNPDMSIKEVISDEDDRYYNSLNDLFKEYWNMSTNEYDLSSMMKPAHLSDFLMGHSELNSLLYGFFERIELYKNAKSLKQHYIKMGMLNEEDTLEKRSIQTLTTVLENLVYDCDFDSISSFVLEKLG